MQCSHACIHEQWSQATLLQKLNSRRVHSPVIGTVRNIQLLPKSVSSDSLKMISIHTTSGTRTSCHWTNIDHLARRLSWLWSSFIRRRIKHQRHLLTASPSNLQKWEQVGGVAFLKLPTPYKETNKQLEFSCHTSTNDPGLGCRGKRWVWGGSNSMGMMMTVTKKMLMMLDRANALTFIHTHKTPASKETPLLVFK